MIDVREKTVAYMRRNFDIQPAVTEAMFDTGILREDLVRRVIIRDEYNRQSPTFKKTELKIHLAERWCLSLSTIEKIITEGNGLFP